MRKKNGAGGIRLPDFTLYYKLQSSKQWGTGTKTEIWISGAGSVQFSSVTQLCPTLCNPMNHSTPGLCVHHQLPESTQTHVHWVGDAIQPFHPLSSPSPPAFNLSQHQGLFQWVSSSHQVAKVLEFQLQHQSFQKSCFRTEITKFIQLYRSKSRFMVA